MDNRIFGIAGREQGSERGSTPSNFVGKLAAVHPAGHDHVGKQEIELGARFDDGEGFGRISRSQGHVPQALQLGVYVVTDEFVVFNDRIRSCPPSTIDAAAASAIAEPPVPGGRYILIVVPWPSSL